MVVGTDITVGKCMNVNNQLFGQQSGLKEGDNCDISHVLVPYGFQLRLNDINVIGPWPNEVDTCTESYVTVWGAQPLSPYSFTDQEKPLCAFMLLPA